MSSFFPILQERSMGDKKEPLVDHKVLDEAILKVLAYQPEKKPRAAKKNSGAAARRGRN